MYNQYLKQMGFTPEGARILGFSLRYPPDIMFSLGYPPYVSELEKHIKENPDEFTLSSVQGINLCARALMESTYEFQEILRMANSKPIYVPQEQLNYLVDTANSLDTELKILMDWSAKKIINYSENRTVQGIALSYLGDSYPVMHYLWSSGCLNDYFGAFQKLPEASLKKDKP
jgi:hypothetical protein